MNDMDSLLMSAFDRYFTHLTQFGRMSTTKSDAIGVLMLVDEIINSPMNEFITEDDYRILEGVVYCLQGTFCLVPYSSCNFPKFPISSNFLSNL